jgi:hypothetical protein
MKYEIIKTKSYNRKIRILLFCKTLHIIFQSLKNNAFKTGKIEFIHTTSTVCMACECINCLSIKSGGLASTIKKKNIFFR